MSIFSNIGKFFFGGPATSNTQGTSTTTTSPYAPAVPYVNQELSNLSTLYNGGAPQISPMEQAGYNQIDSAAAGAEAPGSTINAANAADTDTINGKYLTPDSNPYMADMGKQIAGQTMSTINGTFGGDGRVGSGLDAYYSGKGVSDSLTNLYGGEYDKERALQQEAINQAPALTTGEFTAPDEVATAGQTVSARPFDIANQYAGILANIAKLGGQSTTDSTVNNTSSAQTNGWLINKLFP